MNSISNEIEFELNKLFYDFKDKCIIRGGVIFFPPEIAIEIVGKLRRDKLKILGIDGFKLSSNTTQPFLEHSVDFSSIEKEKTWDLAEKFLMERLKSDLYFEIVVDY